MPSVIHVAHFDPPIHGEAIMAKKLREVAGDWEEIHYHAINAVFSTDRGDLGSFKIRKLMMLVTFLMQTIQSKIKYRADILLIHTPFHPGPFIKCSLFVWLGVLLRMKVIAWVHMDPHRMDLERRSVIFQKWVKWTLCKINRFVACAPSLPQEWPKWLTKYPHTGIANAISDPVANGRCATPGNRHTEKLRVIYLSAMHNEKGWHDLFEAANNICKVRGDVEFHFYGKASDVDEQEVNIAFASSSYAERIQWFGPIWNSEKINKLCDADLFVFPSHTEQFPLSVLEAMACGLPIVSTKVGAVEDALSCPEGGEIVPSGNSKVLEAAILYCLNNRHYLASSGSANRDAFLKIGTLDRFGEEWARVLYSC